MLLQALREELVGYTQAMVAQGLTLHTSGNLSARDEGSGLIAITPSARPYAGMSAQDIVVMDSKGDVVEGQWAPSSEWPMHAIIYQTYPRAGAVVHCHGPYSSTLAAMGRRIPSVYQELCCYCSSPVRVAPFDMPGTKALGHGVVATMGRDNNVCLLQNHGAVAMGATLWHAFGAICAAEQAARMVCLGEPIGSLQLVPEEARRALRLLDPMLSGGKEIAPV